MGRSTFGCPAAARRRGRSCGRVPVEEVGYHFPLKGMPCMLAQAIASVQRRTGFLGRALKGMASDFVRIASLPDGRRLPRSAESRRVPPDCSAWFDSGGCCSVGSRWDRTVLICWPRCCGEEACFFGSCCDGGRRRGRSVRESQERDQPGYVCDHSVSARDHDAYARATCCPSSS